MGGFVEHKCDLSGTTKSDKLIELTVMNLVTAKAGAKHELLFNKPASGHNDTHQNDTQHKGLICNTQHK